MYYGAFFHRRIMSMVIIKLFTANSQLYATKRVIIKQHHFQMRCFLIGAAQKPKSRYETGATATQLWAFSKVLKYVPIYLKY